MGSKVLFQAERQIAELDDQRLVRRPEMLRGLPPKGFTPVSFFGNWPDSAWVQLRDDTEPEATGVNQPRGGLYRWDKDRFRRVKPVDNDERYQPWFPGDGSVGAIVHGSDASVFTLLDGGPKTPVPRLARRSTGERRLLVRATASLPSGHVFVLGVEPAPKLREIPMVERFGPREDMGTLEALPLPPDPPPKLEWYDIAARAPDEAYVIGVLADPPEHTSAVVSYLARFDGTRWKMLDVPQGLWAPQIAMADDGALWVLSDTPQFNPEPPETFTSQLLRRSPTGEWAQIRLRTASGPLGDDVVWSRLFVQGRTIWLVSFPEGRRDRLSVWSSEPVSTVLKMGP